jgi:hypothetical protein
MKRREKQKKIRELPPKEKFERAQRLLWFKLHSCFTKKEYVSYEDLPEELKSQIQPFEEFLWDNRLRI